MGVRAAGAPGSGTAATATSRASGSTVSSHRHHGHRGHGHRGHGHRHHSSHTHFGLGLYLGSPWYYYPYPVSYPYWAYHGDWPYYGDAPYYGSTAVTWVEQQDFYWRYCAPLQTYYPYVKDCPNDEWQLVEPRPAPDSDQPAQSSDAPG